MAKISFSIILFSLYVTKIDSARILAVFPTPSISHQVVFRSLIEGLLSRDHHVTVITPDPAYPVGQAPPNLKEIDLHDISYKIWRDELNTRSVGNRDDLYSQVKSLDRTLITLFKSQLEIKEVQDIINKKNGEYDLLLLEAWVKPIMIFINILKIPVIQVSSLGGWDYNLRAIGAPTHPLLYPPPLHQKLYNLTKLEKVHEIYRHGWYEIYVNQIEKEVDQVLKTKFGPDTPSIKELSNNVDMLFLNIHPIWAENQPVPPSVIYIGGIHTKPPKELRKDLRKYLDSSKNGVIYFSLGTNVSPSLLPPEKIQIFIKVFSQLPYDVLWKWDKDEMPGRSNNIKIFKWLPQSDLLRHPKIRVFITQGGLQSTDEAINAEVPLIGIPMFADQWFNVEKYVHHKIGLRIDLDALTESELKKTILTVIDDNSFHENIKKLRVIMEDEPQSALERAVWWTEHILRHGGGKHLRAAGANISWAEYLELELVIIVAFFLIAILSLVIIAVSRLLNFLRTYGANVKIKVI